MANRQTGHTSGRRQFEGAISGINIINKFTYFRSYYIDYTIQDHASLSNIRALLAIVRIYCQQDIPPPNDMVRLIKDMGFAEPDVIEALKITKNNYSAACDWLIGNRATLKLHQRRQPGSGVIMSNGLDGLEADSTILCALLNSPNVQLSLSNPKIFLGKYLMGFDRIYSNYVFLLLSCSISVHTGGLFGDGHVAGRW